MEFVFTSLKNEILDKGYGFPAFLLLYEIVIKSNTNMHNFFKCFFAIIL